MMIDVLVDEDWTITVTRIRNALAIKPNEIMNKYRMPKQRTILQDIVKTFLAFSLLFISLHAFSSVVNSMTFQTSSFSISPSGAGAVEAIVSTLTRLTSNVQ